MAMKIKVIAMNDTNRVHDMIDSMFQVYLRYADEATVEAASEVIGSEVLGNITRNQLTAYELSAIVTALSALAVKE